MDHDNYTMVTIITAECSTQEPIIVDRADIGVGLASKIILTIIMVITMLGSIFGNSVVCLIVYQKPPMRSAINLLLANMALSNILLALGCMPFALTTLLAESWVFGMVLCRIVAFFHRLFICEAVF